MADHYQTLGLKPGASDAEAKAAFRQLAKECHPDLHPNDAKAEARFKEINQAYEAIVKGDSAQEIPFRSGNFNFHVDDLFGHAFGDILGRPRRNMDTHLECRLTLEDMFIGKDLTIQIPFGRTTKAINVTMPAGIQPGMRVSVPRSGGQMNPGLPPGDLYVVAQQLPHARFHREGNNLLMTLPAAAFDVMLGKELEVIGIDGKTFNVAVPAGYDTSRRLRMSGQGMPDLYTSVRGDLLIELLIAFPELSDEQRRLLQRVVEAGHPVAA